MTEPADVTFTVTMKDREKDGWLEEGLRKQLLTAAVQHIVKELTPAHMEAWAIKLLDDTFKSVHIYDIRKDIEALALPYARQILARPEMQARIKLVVDTAIEEVLKSLPNEVKNILISRVANALRSER